MIIIIMETTTAVVVDCLRPRAPPFVESPVWQLMQAMRYPKMKGLEIPENIFSKLIMPLIWLQ